MFNLNFESTENHLLVPSLLESEAQEIHSLLTRESISSHFLIASSGTTGGQWKGYLISKEALLRNALAVNTKLGLTAEDVWGASLPYYHIGGLSIHVRAKLMGHTPVELRPWSPTILVEKIRQHHVSVISLVPTQVYDLVELELSPPPSLKIVLVGGDFLSKELEKRFTALGWPIVKTYGMTEVSSQLCSGTNEKGFFHPLPIHDLKSDDEHNLFVRSQSFFSYILTKDQDWKLTSISQLLDHHGFYKLPDKGVFKDGLLQLLGRSDGQVKSSGHLINFLDLKERLDKYMLERNIWGKMEIQVAPSERSGSELILHYLEALPFSMVEGFQEEIHPVRLDKIEKQVLFTRTKLGKFKAPST